jgi:disulfide bond formation protein DsbB
MRKYALYFAWIVSLIGVLLSVYYSEILGMDPCRICWYQRCALFPLAVLLGIAAYRDDRNFSRYGLVLAGAGVFLSSMQAFSPTYLCRTSCTEVAVIVGVLTLPMLSAIGFAAIFALLCLSRINADR